MYGAIFDCQYSIWLHRQNFLWATLILSWLCLLRQDCGRRISNTSLPSTANQYAICDLITRSRYKAVPLTYQRLTILPTSTRLHLISAHPLLFAAIIGDINNFEDETSHHNSDLVLCSDNTVLVQKSELCIYAWPPAASMDICGLEVASWTSQAFHDQSADSTIACHDQL